MHVYQDSSVDTEAVRAYAVAVPAGDVLIAVVGLGRGIRVHIHTAAEADALIAAAVEAKRLLDPPAPAGPGGVAFGPFDADVAAEL